MAIFITQNVKCGEGLLVLRLRSSRLHYNSTNHPHNRCAAVERLGYAGSGLIISGGLTVDGEEKRGFLREIASLRYLRINMILDALQTQE